MGEIYFFYGVMGAAKTTTALIEAYDSRSIGLNVKILKPEIDKRDGQLRIRSRIGIGETVELLGDFLNAFFEKSPTSQFDLIIVDEVQFATEEQIEKLAYITDNYNIPIHCYGLTTTFQGELYPGSKRLIEVADEIIHLRKKCWCGNNAIYSSRYGNEGIIRTGKLIELGSENRYIALCRKHYFEGKLRKD